MIRSKEVERQTHALNRYLWPFALFAGIVIMLPYTIICKLFDLKHTVIFSLFELSGKGILIFVLLVTCAILLLLYVPFSRITSFDYKAYLLEDKKLIIGKIGKPVNMDVKNLQIDCQNEEEKNRLTNMFIALKNADYQVVLNPDDANMSIGGNGISLLMTYNQDKSFVTQFFDTELYKKKVYNNPVKIKENKTYIKYKCDNGKKIRIPKIYTGMDISKPLKKEQSIFKRTVKRILLIWVILGIIAGCDIMISAANNDTYVESIDQTYNQIEYNLEQFDYKNVGCYKSGSMHRIYTKDVTETRSSTVIINTNENGDICFLDYELLYNQFTDAEKEEIEYLIKLQEPNISEERLAHFTRCIENIINDNYTINDFDIIEGENGEIRLKSSEGYPRITNTY